MMLHNIFGLIMTVAFCYCYVPQIWEIYKNKSARDVSVTSYVISIVGYTGGMLYMLTGDAFGIWWMLNYFLGIGMCTWVIMLCRKYKQ